MTTDPLGAPWADGTPIDAPFRPRRGRAVAIAMGIIVLVVFIGVAVLIPGPAAGGSWAPLDRLLLVGVGLAIAALMWRYARIRAVPSAEGIQVCNLIVTRRLAWADIGSVRFPDGDPWVTLDLIDEDTVAVMAIQRADGELAQQEAQRLATLMVTRRDRPAS